jgi:hypothetical protein
VKQCFARHNFTSAAHLMKCARAPSSYRQVLPSLTVKSSCVPSNAGRRPFLFRLRNWEYWPIWLANIPTVFFWLFFAVKARKLFFFSTANPGIETGGVLGESKINILRRIPEAYLPVTLFVTAEERDPLLLLDRIKAAGLTFPIIAKPDVGERGFMVEKLDDEMNFRHYLQRSCVAFMVQEFVSLPQEISVMYYQMPGETGGAVTSICVKEMLHVTGDGTTTVEALMAAYPRASLQIERFRREKEDLLAVVPAAGEKLLLEPIGNHSRGTTFLNGNHWIDEELNALFTSVGRRMEGIFYGRFDLKCASIDQLRKGEAFKILEFNGVTAEPAHIYDPSYPIGATYRDIYRHWRIIYQIYLRQNARGVKSMTFGEAWRAISDYQRYMKLAGEPNKY